MAARRPAHSDAVREVEAVRVAFRYVAEYVFSFKDELTPEKPEWGGKPDARRMALGNIYQPCLTNPTLLFNLLTALGKEKGLQSFAQLTGMQSDHSNREAAYFDVVMLVITGTTLMLQFQVENLFQNLWRELGGSEERQFLKLSEKLLSRIKIDAIGEKLKVLRTLGYVRNSLHNNGVHNSPDFEYVIDRELALQNMKFHFEARFIFKRDHRVQCGPIQFAGICLAVAEVVHDVLASDSIRTIPGPIRDRFAWSD